MKKQVCQIKKKASKGSSLWGKKYTIDTKKYKRENVEMKIQLRAKKIKQAELSTDIMPSNQFSNSYNKTS